MERVVRDGEGDAASAGCDEASACLVSAFPCRRMLSLHFR